MDSRNSSNSNSLSNSSTNFYNSGQYGNPTSRGEFLEANTLKTQANLHNFYTETTKEIDNLILGTANDEDPAFEQRKRGIINQMAELDNEIMNQSKKFDDLSKWLAANEHNSRVDIDNVTDPQDPLTKQLLDNVAEDSALEDVMYHLEKALHKGAIDSESCLKVLRQLAAEQCNKRALIKKIHDARRNAQPQGQPAGR